MYKKFNLSPTLKTPPKSTKLCYLDFKFFSVPSFHISLLIKKIRNPSNLSTAIVSVGILCEEAILLRRRPRK